MFHRLGLFVFVSFLLVCNGCGKNYEVGRVSGRVMMDNKPLAQARVSFYPAERTDLPVSIGITNDDGDYDLHLADGSEIEGAVIGTHHVTISQDPRKGLGLKQGDNRNMEAMRKIMKSRGNLDAVPSRYNSQSKMTFTVKEGSNIADFLELKSK